MHADPKLKTPFRAALLGAFLGSLVLLGVAANFNPSPPVFPTPFGRTLIEAASSAAARTILEVGDAAGVTGTLTNWAKFETNVLSRFLTESSAYSLYQGTNANLTAWSGVSTNDFATGLTNAAQANALLTFLSQSGGTISGDLEVTGTLTVPNFNVSGTVTVGTLATGLSAGHVRMAISGGTTNLANVDATEEAIMGKIATNTVTGTGTIPLSSVTDALASKSFDASAAGYTLKQTKYMLLMRPDYGDGVGAIPQTNAFNVSGLMHYKFTGTGETNATWVVYETTVPPDLDTSVEMTATFYYLTVSGTDADPVTFHLTYALGVVGTAIPTGTSIATSPIVLTSTPTTPNALVVQSATNTLTGWAASMTPGTPLYIRVAHLNNDNDDDLRDHYLRIAYGSTQ